MKAAQVGCSEMAINRVLWYADYHPSGHAIYTLPSITDVREFSGTRLKPAILETPYFQRRIQPDCIDNAQLKQFGTAFVHFRGTFTERATTQVPSDFNVHDELDWSRPDVVGLYRSRLEASLLKWTWKISVPTLPGYGIDKSFAESNQGHWFHKCSRCNHWFALCCAWPDAVNISGDPEDDAFVCSKCKRPLGDRGIGEWVAAKPDVANHAGYHVTQLMSLRTAPSSFRNQGGYKWKKQFYWFKLGQPYGAKGVTVNRDVILGCENEAVAWKAGGDHYLAGIDQGDDCWIIIGDPHMIPDHLVIRGLIYIEDDDERFSNVADQLKLYNIDIGVIDAGPNKKSALALCRAFPSRVFASFYSDRQREIIIWPEDKPTMTLNRTDTLDLMMDGIRSRLFQIPAFNENCDVLIKHVENISKQRIVDDEKGKITHRYVSSGPDHYAHSLNLLLVAYTRWLMNREEGKNSEIRSSVLKHGNPVLRRLAGVGPAPRKDASEEESDGAKSGVRWARLTTAEGDAGNRKSPEGAGEGAPPGGYETGGKVAPGHSARPSGSI